VRVRDRRELADQRGDEKDEHEDEGENVDRSTPQIRTVSVLCVLELVEVAI